MVLGLARKVFGTVNDRELKKLKKPVAKINALEEEVSAFSDEKLTHQTAKFREQLAEGATLDDILPMAFAVVREASKRVLGMRHFDVQLMGGIVLHQGKITEMRTGEGKTLVATLAVYLNALAGKGVHVITVNDYLVQRDAAWMGKLYQFLGLSVGCIISGMNDDARKQAYACDITNGTNNEFGFDYLRDNMKFSDEEMVQRGHHYAIVDEVDSILVDEARTPLVISGPAENNSQLYVVVDKLMKKLQESDYEVDEKARNVILTDDGTEHIEQLLKEIKALEESASMYDVEHLALVHHVNQSLRAHKLFVNDKDYIVKDKQVIIIDEFTGRMMDGRRYSDGLHQALEAKENVPIQNENQTLASVTFQNYFRLYGKLAGMTGTAMTEAEEFSHIYKLDVVSVPPNLIVSRKDEDDAIYRTAAEKYDAIIESIKECHKRKQPVLVGTVSIENSESLAKILKKHKIPHEVLNAKNHAREASIIAQAGSPGAVTIATNMAGRGTDIVLGGNAEMLIDELKKKIKDPKVLADKAKEITAAVKEAKAKVIKSGGLFVLATERHESRRIDNQLRGRAGRQGDPGVSKFFLSLEDDLMRIFGSERISGMLKRLGLEEGEAIYHPWISRAIEKAQMRVEGQHYEIRKSLLKFDDVMNDQRKVVYGQRLEMITADDVSGTIEEMVEGLIDVLIATYIPAKSYPEEWDTDTLRHEGQRIFALEFPFKEWAAEEGIADEEIKDRLNQAVAMVLQEKEKQYGEDLMRLAEKKIMLLTLDQLWKEHLLSLDQLKQGIGLRAYGQKDPLNEYKREAFDLFEAMINQLDEIVIARLMRMELEPSEEAKQRLSTVTSSQLPTHEGRSDVALEGRKSGSPEPHLVTRKRIKPGERDPANPDTWGKVSRNEACPCGSGKKFKHCHGVL
jgi:preprotein translocase subunit SecA